MRHVAPRVRSGWYGHRREIVVSAARYSRIGAAWCAVAGRSRLLASPGDKAVRLDHVRIRIALVGRLGATVRRRRGLLSVPRCPAGVRHRGGRLIGLVVGNARLGWPSAGFRIGVVPAAVGGGLSRPLWRPFIAVTAIAAVSHADTLPKHRR